MQAGEGVLVGPKPSDDRVHRVYRAVGRAEGARSHGQWGDVQFLGSYLVQTRRLLSWGAESGILL